jgi:hypothetical protein
MNPWPALGQEPPFVLPDDREVIVQFNARATERTRLELDLLPEPFVGRLDAPVVLLTLNPGVSDGDFALHNDPAFRDRIRACHRQDKVAWPYYYLAPEVTGPGARWSARVLGPLIRELSLGAVSRGVALFEYLPYHSRGFGHARLEVASQAFTMAAVRVSIASAAAIFITRGAKLWSTAIPELVGHPHLFTTRSTQNIVISPRNCPAGWDSAVAGIRQAG